MTMAPQERPLAAGDVHWWSARLDPAPPAVAALEATLSAEERQRASRFAFPHLQRRYVVGRGLLRQWLAAYLHVAPSAVRFAYEAHGKPVFDASIDSPIRFNLSHSGDVAVFALTASHRIGVDVELVRPMADALALSERFFSAAERRALREAPAAARDAAFFSCWTRKEAYIKAIGEGLSCPLDSFDVSVAPAAPQLLQVGGSVEAAAAWTIAALDLPAGVIGAVAVEAAEVCVRHVGGVAASAIAGVARRTA